MMQKIEADVRVSTGPLQIGQDWPGVFIRGDEIEEIIGILRSYSKALREGKLPNPPEFWETHAKHIERKIEALSGSWVGP